MAKFYLKKLTHPMNVQDTPRGIWIRLEGEGLGWEEFITWEEWGRLVAWTSWRQLEQGINKNKKQ